jgi:hypothetical protein
MSSTGSIFIATLRSPHPPVDDVPGSNPCVEASKEQAQERGYDQITLRTYADVPWNAPFYTTASFIEEEPATHFHRSLVSVEATLGLDRYGRRVHMVAHLNPPRPIADPAMQSDP